MHREDPVRNGLLYLFSLILIVVICLAFVGTRIGVLRVGYAYSSAFELHRDLLREHSRLLLESASLKSPERIERIAQTELGMVYPSPDQIIQAGR